MPSKRSLFANAKSLGKNATQGFGQKAQAGLEYLITYGWALIAIATIIGVLVFVASGGINTNTCTTFLKLVCKGVVADGDTLVMVLQNACGQKISITPFEDICFDGICGYGKIEYNGIEYRFETVEIGAGEQFKVIGAGQVLAKEMSITYKEGSTGLEKTVTSSLGTNAPKTIELSNDGIDNDGDGAIDCADPELIAAATQCEYVVSPTSITQVAANTVTISFGTLNSFGSADPIAGNWNLTQSTIVFKVESYIGGTTITATNSSAETEILSNPRIGINSATFAVPLILFESDNIGTYTLASPGNFTVSSAKVVLTLTPL